MWKTAERHLFLGCSRWNVCWLVAGGKRSTRFRSVFCSGLASCLKTLTDSFLSHFRQVACPTVRWGTIGIFWKMLGVSRAIFPIYYCSNQSQSTLWWTLVLCCLCWPNCRSLCSIHLTLAAWVGQECSIELFCCQFPTAIRRFFLLQKFLSNFVLWEPNFF